MLARDGRLWVATSGGACLLKPWDGKTAIFESVAARLGRRPEPVDALLEDAEGKVWLGPRRRRNPLLRLAGRPPRRPPGAAAGLDLRAARRNEGGTGAGEEPGAGDLLFFLLDLDHFKSVNDTHGHAAGDAVLAQTAGVLRQAVRTSDHLVRWGGEEFLVVARFVDRRSAPALAEKIRAAIEGHIFELPEGGTLRRTVSIGYAAYPSSLAEPRALTWQETVALADTALYSAKREGRNRAVGVEEGEVGDPRESLRRLQEDPERALEAGAARFLGPRP